MITNDEHDDFDLTSHGVTVTQVHRNLSPSALYEHAIRFEKDASIAENGALVAYSGVKTGRSPKDKRVVKNPASENDIWWGPVNIPFDEHTFQINRQRALDYLNTRERLYCFDGFAGWDPKYRIKVRVICSRPYHALFMHTMLIRPTNEELASFGAPDFVIYNAGSFPANRLTTGMGSTTSIDLSLEDKELTALPGVPADILRPRESWADKSAYDATAKKLASHFNQNFATYAAGASVEVKAAATAA